MLEGCTFSRVAFPLDNMVTTQNLDVKLNREVIKVVHVEEEDSSFFEVYYKEHGNNNRKLAKKAKTKAVKRMEKTLRRGKRCRLKWNVSTGSSQV